MELNFSSLIINKENWYGGKGRRCEYSFSSPLISGELIVISNADDRGHLTDS